MHVIQSQLVNYSYGEHSQKNIKLVRWWILENIAGADGIDEVTRPFTKNEEDIFFQFMEDHPANFPRGKTDRFESVNLVPPLLDHDDQPGDVEKPCLLLVRAKANHNINGLCRRMDIVLENDLLPVQLPFDLAGEIILEKV